MLTMKRSRLSMNTPTETTRAPSSVAAIATSSSVAFCNWHVTLARTGCKMQPLPATMDHALPPVQEQNCSIARHWPWSASAGRCWSCATSCSAAAASGDQAQDRRRAEHPQRPAGTRSSSTGCSRARSRTTPTPSSTARRARAATSAPPQPLMHWGDKHVVPAGGPPRVMVHTACGHDADPRLHCATAAR